MATKKTTKVKVDETVESKETKVKSPLAQIIEVYLATSPKAEAKRKELEAKLKANS